RTTFSRNRYLLANLQTGVYNECIKLTSTQKRSGFTIVELLIVIVVIAILAAISVVAYTGVQARAKDSQRHQDIKIIAKALEMYYIDHGSLPTSSCGSSCPN